MSEWRDNDGAILRLVFSNGNDLILSNENYSTDNIYKDSQYITVNGTVENESINAKFINEYESLWDLGDLLEYATDMYALDYEEFDPYEFTVRDLIDCTFNLNVISDIINARSVDELINKVTKMYYISYMDVNYFLQIICPDCPEYSLDTEEPDFDDDIKNELSFLEDNELALVKDGLDALKNAEKTAHSIDCSVAQIIKENMQTMADLKEVTLAAISFAETDFYDISFSLGRDIWDLIKKLHEESGDNFEDIISGLKNIDALENVSEDSLAKIVHIYNNDTLKRRGTGYAIKQTWKKGEKININYMILDHSFSGTKVSELDNWNGEDFDGLDADDIAVELVDGITYVKKHEQN